MGTVYEAEHLGLGRAVAVKVLNPSQAKKRVAVKRFQQEARAAGAIGHPNICEVYDLGLLDDGSPYLVMEKLIGTTLADRISREGGLPFDEIADVMIQVLSGLIAAHDKGIVHRDIKPENIFLARRVGCPPIVKILDFGVSKMMPQFQGGDEQLDLTRTGMVMGTPYYMSPEQARGERNLDGRVDVYACGVMMYEAIVGKRPFLGAELQRAPPLDHQHDAQGRSARFVPRHRWRSKRSSCTRWQRPATIAIRRRTRCFATSRRFPSPRTCRGTACRRLPRQRSGCARRSSAEGTSRALATREEAAARSTRGGARPRCPRAPKARARPCAAAWRSRSSSRPPFARTGERDAPRHQAVRCAQRASRTLRRERLDRHPDPHHRLGPAAGPAPPADRAPRVEVERRAWRIRGRDAHRGLPARRTHRRRPGTCRHAVPRRRAWRRRSDLRPIRPAPAPAPAPAPPSSMGPVNLSGLVGDDWDGETVVKKPAMLTTSRHRDRPSKDSGRQVHGQQQQHTAGRRRSPSTPTRP